MINPFLNRQTVIKQNSTIRFTRQLPTDMPGRLLVAPGESVSPVQILAESPQESGFSIIPLASQLRIRPDQLDPYLLVQPGDMIRLGMPLAEKKGLFGFKNEIEATMGGMLIDIYDGNLLVQQTPSTYKLRALVNGTVLYTLFDQGAVIECRGSYIQGLWSTPYDGYGRLKLIGEGPEHVLNQEDLLKLSIGDILAVSRIADPDLLTNLVDEGIKGVIAGLVSPDVYRWAQRTAIPFMITDGIGPGEANPQIFEILGDSNRSAIAMTSGLYSEGERPEIICGTDKEQTPRLSEPEDSLSFLSSGDAQSPQGSRPELSVGQRVRILRAPYLGQEGTVKTIFHYPRYSNLKVRTVGADVVLKDGTVLFMPDRNLDIII